MREFLKCMLILSVSLVILFFPVIGCSNNDNSVDSTATGTSTSPLPTTIPTVTPTSTESPSPSPTGSPQETPTVTPMPFGEVVFDSDATNLVDPDTNGMRDVFMRDVNAGTTTIVSVKPDGSRFTAGDSSNPQLSTDGRFVVFQTVTKAPCCSLPNGKIEVFRRNLSEAHSQLVSLKPDGTQPDGSSTLPSVSGLGQYVAFVSTSTDLVEGKSDGHQNVFMKDVDSGAVTMASIRSDGAIPDGASSFPSFSSNSNFIAFESTSTNLIFDDTNGKMDVFLYVRQAGNLKRISIGQNGSESNGDSTFPSACYCASYVSFTSTASNLVEGDTNGMADIFMHAHLLGQTVRVSVSTSGEQANANSYTSAYSLFGGFVAFSSDASNLVSVDANGKRDVFVRDMSAGTTELVSVRTDGIQSNGNSTVQSISFDGRYVAFISDATNLVDDDTNNTWDVFVRDRQTGFTSRASLTSSGGQSNGPSYGVSICGWHPESPIDMLIGNIVP